MDTSKLLNVPLDAEVTVNHGIRARGMQALIRAALAIKVNELDEVLAEAFDDHTPYDDAKARQIWKNINGLPEDVELDGAKYALQKLLEADMEKDGNCLCSYQGLRTRLIEGEVGGNSVGAGIAGRG